MPQSGSGQLSLPGIALRLLAAERWYTAMLGAAAAILVAVALAPPLLEGAAAHAGVREILAGSGGVTVRKTKIADATQFDAFQRQAGAKVDPVFAGRLLGPAQLASLGPLPAASVNGVPPAAPATQRNLLVAYSSDLARHVEVVQGELPDAIQDRTVAAASMSEAQADRVGLHLSDQVCFAAASPSDEPWCPRLVGLWRALDSTDPYWALSGPRPNLFTNQSGFFTLLALQSSPDAMGQRWYWPDPAMTPAQASSLGDQVRHLRASIATSPGLALQTSLDGRMSRYAAANGVVTFSVELLTASLVALSLLLVLVLARRLVELQTRELTLLMVRGWAPAQSQRLLVVELGLVAGAALPAGIVLAWLALILLNPAHAIWPLDGLDLSDLAGTGAALAASLLGVQLVSAFVTSWATRPSWFRRVPAGQSFETTAPGIRGAVVAVLVLAAAILLLLPRLAGAQPSPSSPGAFVSDFGYLLYAAALGMLAAGALYLVSPASALLARGYRGVEGTVARWQLRSWWRHHPALGFIVVFAIAIATFAAVNIAHLLMDGGAAPALIGPGAFRLGVVGALGAGFLAALLIAVLAFVAELSFACASRLPDYGALMADGLPARSVRRSLALEHNHVLVLGVPVGAILGLALVWGVAPVAGFDGGLAVPAARLSTAGAATGVLVAAVSISIGGLVAGGLVRRRVRFLPFELPGAPY